MTLTGTERINEGIFGLAMLVGTAFDLGAAAKAVGGASRFARAEQKLVGTLGRWAERLGEGGEFAKQIGKGIDFVTSLSDEGRAMKLAEAEARGGRAAEEAIGAESRGERAVAETADEAGTAERTADDVTKSHEASGSAPGCPTMRCFTQGTEVVGEDGESSRVERVKAGDRVAAYDEAGKTVTGRNVVKTFARIVPETIRLRIQGEPKALEVSPDHPFFAKRARSNTSGEKDADGEWREAFRLRVGDLVKTRLGKWVKVLRVTHLKQPKVVYNFEVAQSHTYFVGRQGVLVHNTGGCPPIEVSGENFTMDLGGDWRSTQFSTDQKGILYILRDKKTGELLKTGKTEITNKKWLSRFGHYENAAKLTQRELVLDIFTVEKNSSRSLEFLESQLRDNLVNLGNRLRWDNAPMGGLNRLGRPGPGVPGVSMRKSLRGDYMWYGETFTRKFGAHLGTGNKKTLVVNELGETWTRR